MSTSDAINLVCRVAAQYANGTTPEFNQSVHTAIGVVQRLKQRTRSAKRNTKRGAR